MFSFLLGKKKLQHTFFVTIDSWATEYQGIFGFDFLKAHNAIVDISNNCIKFEDEEIKINEECSTSPELNNQIWQNSFVNKINNSRHITNIKVAPTCKIKFKPNETKLVNLKVQNFNIADSTVFFEPNSSTSGINFSDSITLVQNNIFKILATNSSNEPHTLHKDHCVGHIEHNIEVVTDNSEEITKHINTLDIEQKSKLNLNEMYDLRKNELLESDFSLHHLKGDFKNKLSKFLMDNYKVFSKSYKTLGCTDAVVPELKLAHNFPIQTKPYPVPQILRPVIKDEITKLLDADIITPSQSSYAFPILLIRKKQPVNASTPDQKQVPSASNYRLAVDYRLLNQITELYPYHLPHIKELLHEIAGYKFYSVCDLKSAFFQIMLPEDQQQVYTFTCELGNFSQKRMPFGSKNSTSYFNSLMDKCLGDLQDKQIRFFLDDIIIAADSEEEMLAKLQLVFERLKNFNLTLDPQKLQICKENITYLGYEINQHGITPSPSNVTKINNFPVPHSTKNVKTFLGMTNYFRSLIANYAEIAQPLVDLTKKNVKFHWNANTQDAFVKLQNAILSKPVVQKADSSKPFFIMTDASKIAISGILLQNHDGNFHPVEFFSRKLKDSEARYPSLKLELLAIHDTVKHFFNYLYGVNFTILTDAKALTYHLKLNKQSDIVARWLLYLQQFDYKIKHIPGNQNAADFFSRVIFTDSKVTSLINTIFEADPKLNIQNILNEQLNDEAITKIKTDVINGKFKLYKTYYIDAQTKLLMKTRRSKGKISRLKRKMQSNMIVLPKSLQQNALKLAHSSHFATKKTYNLLTRNYTWLNAYKETDHFCNNCHQCLTFKNKRIPKQPVTRMTKDYAPSECISIDIVGKLPQTFKNHSFIITIVDHFSRMLEAIPVASITAQSIISVLSEYFGRFGLPRILISDNGSQMKATEVKQFLESLNIQHNFTSIYRPTGNGLLEWTHSSLKQNLACMANESLQWNENLKYFKLMYNNTIHRMTSFTPAQLYFNRNQNTPIDIDGPPKLIANSNLAKYVQNQMGEIKNIRKWVLKTQEDIYDKEKAYNEPPPVRNFQLGSQVYLKSLTAPLAMKEKFSGPWTVTKMLRNNNAVIQHNVDKTVKKVHIDHLFLQRTG